MMGNGSAGMMWTIDILGLLLLAALVLGIAAPLKYLFSRKSPEAHHCSPTGLLELSGQADRTVHLPVRGKLENHLARCQQRQSVLALFADRHQTAEGVGAAEVAVVVQFSGSSRGVLISF
ncbi:hypothetical protein [Hyphomicrobium sp.]|jgi:hypothetical protein|uniref:hypothetical protein n=1 Tax=Hyphomicrobium sp. TaxID=82 RepID=UPI0035672B96